MSILFLLPTHILLQRVLLERLRDGHNKYTHSPVLFILSSHSRTDQSKLLQIKSCLDGFLALSTARYSREKESLLELLPGVFESLSSQCALCSERLPELEEAMIIRRSREWS